jgi:hypothetical protein
MQHVEGLRKAQGVPQKTKQQRVKLTVEIYADRAVDANGEQLFWSLDTQQALDALDKYCGPWMITNVEPQEDNN